MPRLVCTLGVCLGAAALASAAQLPPRGTVLFVTGSQGDVLELRGRDLYTGSDRLIHAFGSDEFGEFWHQASGMVNRTMWVVSMQAANATTPSPTNGSIAVTDIATSPPRTVVTRAMPNCWAVEALSGGAAACFNEDEGAETTTLWRIDLDGGRARPSRIGAFARGLVPLNELGWCGRHGAAGSGEACCGVFGHGVIHCLDAGTGAPLPGVSIPSTVVVNSVARFPGRGGGGEALAMISAINASSGKFCVELAAMSVLNGTFRDLQPAEPTAECWRHGVYSAWDEFTPQATAAEAQQRGAQGPWMLVVAWDAGVPGKRPPQRHLLVSSAANGNLTYTAPIPSQDRDFFSLAWTSQEFA